MSTPPRAASAWASLRVAVRAFPFGFFACAPVVQAADHALVMTIGRYADGQQLPGVAHDRHSALRMIDRIGFAPGPRVASPADEALDLAGLQRSLARLVDDVQPGDRVFVYYSGHGTSSLVDGRCEQGLLAHDGRVLGAGTLARELARITERASQLVVVLDACYSGGVAGVGPVRSLGASTPAGWRPKFAKALTADPTTPDQCGQPTNLLDLVPQPRRGAVNLERNFLYIAAARKDEVAFDHDQTGGLATTALLSCLDAQAAAGGRVQFAALAACAQAGVERALPPDPRLKPQHLVLAGNESLVVQRAVPVSVPASTASAALHPTVARMLAGADGAWPVQLQATPPVLTIRQDMLSLRITSPREGYLSLFYLGSDGKRVAHLYPARASDAAYVRAGVPFDVPRRWRSEGPAGTNQIIAVVAPRPRTLADWDGTAAPTSPPPGCTRNLGASVDCGPAPGTDDGTYGAALINVREQP